MASRKPVTQKFRQKGENARLEYGVSAMQGFREQMEDAHVTLLDFDAASATSFFAIYDGHGGPAVAKYCAKHLHTELRANGEFQTNPATAVENTFLRMDVMLRDSRAGKELSKYDVKGGPWKQYGLKKTIIRGLYCKEKPVYVGPINDGCTACVALIRGHQIIVGNAGDSRCVISRNGQAIDLSIDHKPNLPAESERIQAAGHEVNQLRGQAFRIDNGIAISRAIGDLRYKNNREVPIRNQAVTALPEVRTEEITAGTEFLVIACDGIWDCMTSQQVVDFIRSYTDHAEPDAICASLLDHCLAQPRGQDNMSIILVKFKEHAPQAPQPRVQPSQPLPPQQSLPPQPPASQQPPLPEFPIHPTPDEKTVTGSVPSSFTGATGASASASSDPKQRPKSI